MDNCKVLEVTKLLGKKWTPVLLQEINLNGNKGFNLILNRMSKISPKILSKRLKELESNQLIIKKMSSIDSKKRVSYQLTEKGHELYSILSSIKDWKTKYNPDEGDCSAKECVTCKNYTN